MYYACLAQGLVHFKNCTGSYFYQSYFHSKDAFATPYSCQLIYNKGGKNKCWRKDNLFNKWYRENWTATHKRKRLEHFLAPYSKINSK